MNFEKIQQIDSYISKNNTGKAEDFAKKMNISRGMLYRYIKYIKDELNAPISYNRYQNTYQYTQSGKLYIKGWEEKL